MVLGRAVLGGDGDGVGVRRVDPRGVGDGPYAGGHGGVDRGLLGGDAGADGVGADDERAVGAGEIEGRGVVEVAVADLGAVDADRVRGAGDEDEVAGGDAAFEEGGDDGAAEVAGGAGDGDGHDGVQS